MTRPWIATAMAAALVSAASLLQGGAAVAGSPSTSVALDDTATCEGGDAIVRVGVDTGGEPLGALDVAHEFDDTHLAVISVFKTHVTLEGYTLFSNVLEDAGPDALDIALFTAAPDTPAPAAEVLWVLMRSTGGSGTFPLTLDPLETRIDEQVVTVLTDGSITVGAGDVRIAAEDSASGAPGAVVYVPIYAEPSADVNAFDIELWFDPLVIDAVGVQTTAATSGFTVTPNLLVPGRVVVSLFSPVALPASGPVAIAEVAFQVVGTLGDATGLDIRVGVSDDDLSTCLDDGWFEVCADQDGDGVTACVGDSDDCDDADPDNMPSLVSESLLVAKSSGDVADLSWNAGMEPGPFRLYRGFRDAEAPFAYVHTCLGGPIAGTTASDPDVPVSHRLFYYLLSRESSCGESGLGFASDATPRPNADPCASQFADADGDGVEEAEDNCPGLANPAQSDADGDGDGDDCDNCDSAYNPDQADLDADDTGDACDPDDDGDGELDGTDNCPLAANPMQEDGEGDGVGDVCDTCPFDDTPNELDLDHDGVGDGCDNCPADYNPAQEDGDSDDLGDVCDPMP